MLSFTSTHWQKILGIACTSVSVVWICPSQAQITPDSTLSNNSTVNLQGNTTLIEAGTRAGSNLFHSFKEFSIPTGAQAHFNNSVNINNIITRVTGGNISNIDGLIKANGTANLFLINPSGIVFGENARLDIGGSFVGSTADAIGFDENNFFSASDPQNSSSLLQINPNSLFFNQIQTASIENNSVADVGLNPSDEYPGRGLRVPDGKSLLLVGGDVNMDGGGLVALGGRVELGGLTGKGTVGLNVDGNNLRVNFPSGVEKSDVTLSNAASVKVGADDGGSIAVNARNFQMTGITGEASFLFAGINEDSGSEQSKAGNIDINATNAINLSQSDITNQVQIGATGQAGDVNISTSRLQVENGSRIIAATRGEGSGGNLNIDAQDVELIRGEGSLTGLFVQARRESTGDGGDLNLKANTLLVLDGGRVDTITFAIGKGGTINIEAQDVQVIGSTPSGIWSRLSTRASSNSTGDAGDLNLKTNTLLIKDGGWVSTNTLAVGNAGTINIEAEDVQVIGSTPSGIWSRLVAEANSNSTGDGGDLNLKTNTLLVLDGGRVSASTFAVGNAGTINLEAQDVQVIGSTPSGSYSRLSAQANRNSTGDAGDLNLKTNTLLIKDGGRVSTNTLAVGKGGTINLEAQDVQVIGSTPSGSYSRLSAQANRNSTGDAGDLNLKTNTLLIKDGGRVSTNTLAVGKGGTINLEAQDVRVIGRSKDSQTAVSGLFVTASQNSAGDAGNLTIKTNTLLVRDGAQIGASTLSQGKGGNLNIEAQDVQVIGRSEDDSIASRLTARAGLNLTGDAGNLTIRTNTLLVRDGAQVDVATFGEGNGGDLTVEAQDVQLIGRSKNFQAGSGLFASAEENSTGNAGNLTVKTNTLLVRDGAQVVANTFSQGNGGILTVEAQKIQLIGRSGESGEFSSGLFAQAFDSTGNAGNLNINTGILQVNDGAGINVLSSGTGAAGNLTINADSIRLDNYAVFTADTRNNEVAAEKQATININSNDLIMRRGSNIFTNAEGENVRGGNINIDADVIAAFENSDITANSDDFRGGNVIINTQGLFGIQFRPQETDFSDITATGASEDLSGNVEIINPDIDANIALVNLPSIPVETEVAQTCTADASVAQSKFEIIGRGGLPLLPTDALSADAVEVDLVSIKPEVNKPVNTNVSTKANTSTPKKIVEATGWIRNEKGEIFFVADGANQKQVNNLYNKNNCRG